MSTAGERRSALVVAVSDYEDPKFRQLRSPSRDAAELARVLSDPKVGPYDVQTSLNERDAVVRRKLEGFFTGPDRRRDDLLLLHLSCHGVKDAGGELYFAATDTALDSLRSTAVSARFVTDLMRDSRASRIVLFLDCCYSGAFARGFLPRSDDDVHVMEWFAGEGRAVITASKATEYAFEGGELRDELTSVEPQPSVFTTALVKGLSSGEADRDRDGLISFDELYDYVHDEVLKATPHQTPSKSVPRMEGRLFIARSDQAPRLPAPLLDAVESPLPGVRKGAVDELVGILHGSRPALAEVARATLERLLEDDSLQVREAAGAALGRLEPERGAVADPEPPPPAPEPPPEPRKDDQVPPPEPPVSEPPPWPEEPSEPPPPGEGPPPREPLPPIVQRRDFRRSWLTTRLATASLGVGLLAVVVPLLVILLRGGDADELEWRPADASAGGVAFSVASDGVTGTVLAVGQDSAGRAAAWTVAPGSSWVGATGLGEGSFRAVALVDSERVRAVAVGRAGPESDEQDAAVWVLDEERGRDACGNECGGARHQDALGITELGDAPGTFVVVGRDNGPEGGLFDAAVWEVDVHGRGQRLARDEASLRGELQQQMEAVVDLDGTLVAVGQDGPRAGVWESTDGGQTWEKPPGEALESREGSFLHMLAVARRGAELIAVGRESIGGVHRGAAWIRAAGGTWERAESSDFGLRGQELRAVASTSDGLLVAVGWDDNLTGTPRAAVWTSRDGRRWQRGRGPPQAGGATQMYGVTLAGDRIVAVGSERTGTGAAARLWSAALP